MTGIYCAAFLVVLTSQWTFTGGDTDVSCTYMQRCTLPCSFDRGTDVVIHWFQISGGNLFVHLFYEGYDQLGVQNQRFRGRTSLFSDQVSTGNASLQLTGVKVQDEGRYRCYTSTAKGVKESFINLKMDAPIHEIDIQREGNSITCSSEGIYPKPELTWSTSPPSNVNLKCKTGLQETEQHLYNISSSLTPSDNESALSFSCTISTRCNMRTVTLSPLSKPNHSGAILGGVIVAIIVVAVAAVVGLMLLKRKKDSSEQQENHRGSRKKSDTELQPMANVKPSAAIDEESYSDISED